MVYLCLDRKLGKTEDEMGHLTFPVGELMIQLDTFSLFGHLGDSNSRLLIESRLKIQQSSYFS